MTNRSTTLDSSGFSHFRYDRPDAYRHDGAAKSPGNHQFAVLTFCSSESMSQRGGSRAASAIDRQIEAIRGAGFQFSPLSNVIDNSKCNEALPQKTVAITIDARNANPDSPELQTLKALEVPTTVFLSTSQLEEQREIDRQKWHRLALSGLIEFGAQPSRRQNAETDPVSFHEDLVSCFDHLESEFAVTQPAFAFPVGSGHCDGQLAEIALAAGAFCCLTDRQELVDLHSKSFQWARFHVTESDSPQKIVGRLQCGFSTWSHLWRTLRSKMPTRSRRLPMLLADGI